jgi:hypothetical protein
MLAETVTVWVNSGGVPERAVWEGVQYRVTDTPTPLDVDINFVTHVPFLPKGWRFQGTNEQGESLIFDVVSVNNGQTWRVLKTYR